MSYDDWKCTEPDPFEFDERDEDEPEADVNDEKAEGK